MSAQDSQKTDKGGAFFHIYNQGVSGKTIFKDKQDYEMFLDFLKEYLTPPTDKKLLKKNFIVKGHTFQGVPHLTKNYCDKIYLIAYTLLPDHFHLIIKQLAPGALERFVRSLCTRYSMYFNKRHQSSGALFKGPYKSACTNSIPLLTQLTRYLYQEGLSQDTNPAGGYSSYPEYLGKRQTLWVKPNEVLSLFNNLKNTDFRGVRGYKHFVENYDPDQKAKTLLEGIILENYFGQLERNNSTSVKSLPVEEPLPDFDFVHRSRLTGYGITTTMFVLLFSFGLRNVWISSAKAKDTTISVPSIPLSTASPAVSAAEDEQPPKVFLTIKITDGAKSINIRQGPAINSPIIGKARTGDIFEFVSVKSGWYEVKLADGSTGFISAKYLEVIKDTKIQ
jgi:putative transposase